MVFTGGQKEDRGVNLLHAPALMDNRQKDLIDTLAVTLPPGPQNPCRRIP